MPRTVLIFGVQTPVRDIIKDVVGILCLFALVYILLLLGAGFQKGPLP